MSLEEEYIGYTWVRFDAYRWAFCRPIHSFCNKKGAKERSSRPNRLYVDGEKAVTDCTIVHILRTSLSLSLCSVPLTPGALLLLLFDAHFLPDSLSYIGDAPGGLVRCIHPSSKRHYHRPTKRTRGPEFLSLSFWCIEGAGQTIYIYIYTAWFIIFGSSSILILHHLLLLFLP